MRYFEFSYTEIKDGEIVSKGDALYYTTATQNLDEMKGHIRQSIKAPLATINIIHITEIDYDNFLQKWGNVNGVKHLDA